MPRPKGSKNKKTLLTENLQERITAAEQEVAALTEQLKDKKAELKKMLKEKARADKLAAAKKAEEDKAKLLEAISASGKSVEEILEMLK